MFFDNQVVKSFEGEEKIDKFAIAASLMEVSFKGAACSILESRVVNNCEGCNLKFLCMKVDQVVEEYVDKTTVVTESFNF